MSQVPSIDLNSKHIHIDIETLSTKSNALVVSIGWCKFDASLGIGEGKEFRVAHEKSKVPQFDVDLDTVAWWMEQSQSSRESTFTRHGPQSVVANEIIAELLRDMKETNGGFIWSKHKQFDFPIIRNLANVYGIKYPVSHRQERCYAEAVRYLNIPTREVEAQHTALQDAIDQSQSLLSAWRGSR